MSRNRTRRFAVGLLAASAALAMAVPAAQASPKAVTAPKPELPAVSYKYTLSKIAWTGSVEAIAATDSHGDLFYFWRGSSGSRWHKRLVAKSSSGKRYSKPAIAWTGHEVLIVALDSAGDLVSFRLRAASSTWRYQRIARASGGKYQAPSVTVGGGTILISAGAPGQLVTFQRATGSGTWIKQTVSAGTFGPSSVSFCYDHHINEWLGLVVATSHGNLYFWWEYLTSPGWNVETVAQAGGGAGNLTGGSVTASPGDIYITADTTGGLLDFWYQGIGGSGWTVEVVANGAPWYTHPQVGFADLVNSTPYSFDYITAVSDTGTLDIWMKEDGATNTAWTQETVAAAGTMAKYANPAMVMTSKAAVITAINGKLGDVNSWYQLFQSTRWHEQLVAKG